MAQRLTVKQDESFDSMDGMTVDVFQVFQGIERAEVWVNLNGSRCTKCLTIDRKMATDCIHAKAARRFIVRKEAGEHDG